MLGLNIRSDHSEWTKRGGKAEKSSCWCLTHCSYPHITELPEILLKLGETLTHICRARSNDCIFTSMTYQDQKITLHYKFILSHAPLPKKPAVSVVNSVGSVFKRNHYFPKLDTELFKKAVRHLPESCGTTILQAGAHHVFQGDWNFNKWGASKRVNGDELSNKNICLKKN